MAWQLTFEDKAIVKFLVKKIKAILGSIGLVKKVDSIVKVDPFNIIVSDRKVLDMVIETANKNKSKYEVKKV
jgi:hypothetical protein